MFSINVTIIEVFYELLPELEATKLFIDLMFLLVFFCPVAQVVPELTVYSRLTV